MNKIFLAILLSSLIAGLLGYSALAVLILTPTDDTYTDLNDQGSNFDGQALIADYSNGPCTVSRRIYLRFNVSSLPIDVGPQTAVRVYMQLPPATAGNLALWSTGDDWNGATAGVGDETTLTWSNAPAVIQQLDTRPSGTALAWIEFTGSNLSSYINQQRSANGGDNIASFAIQWADCIDTVYDIAVFEDRENTLATNNTPELYPLSPTAISLSTFNAVSSLPTTLLIVAVLFMFVSGIAIMVIRSPKFHKSSRIK